MAPRAKRASATEKIMKKLLAGVVGALALAVFGAGCSVQAGPGYYGPPGPGGAYACNYCGDAYNLGDPYQGDMCDATSATLYNDLYSCGCAGPCRERCGAAGDFCDSGMASAVCDACLRAATGCAADYGACMSD
jgi:hypothetical protein